MCGADGLDSGARDGAAVARQAQLIQALEASLARAGRPVQRYETHISWVLVTDGLAYKFKKALRFDVLDYSTLEARRHFCEEELRLNGRLAPGLYLGLSVLGGSRERPALDGAGAPLEYAVRMRAFAQEALWNERLAAGSLGPSEVDALAALLVAFHGRAEVAPASSPWGGARALEQAARVDLTTVAGMVDTPAARAQVRMLAGWRAARWELDALFGKRKDQGQVRACHGDLHCGNILTLGERVQVFDCIEFNEELRWTDVMSDLAFAVMDLRFHGRADLASRLLERYLDGSGDYPGLAVLGYYQTMRALVRCKVWLLRARGAPGGAPRSDEAARLAQRYLDFATDSVADGRPVLVLTHGYPGSGKSRYGAMLAEALQGVRIRSDVERKRLHGLAPTARATAAPGAGIYTEASTRATYARLQEMARYALHAGLPVVVDAAFLQAWQREPFQRMARALHIPFRILDLRAREATLRARLARRALEDGDASDAGPEQLARQVAQAQPLTRRERRHVSVLDTEDAAAAATVAALAATLRPAGG